MIETEIEIRRQCDAPVDRDEFARRFPAQSGLLNALCDRPAVNSAADVKPDVRETVRPTASSDSVAEKSSSPGTEMPEQFGRYRILKQLGEGAMGTVYLAEDSQLQRKVALKTPTFGGRGAEEMVSRFYSEARSSATLRHPNICPVFDVGEIDGRHFISMAYIKGRVLSQYINSGKQLPERTAAALVRKLARDLGHAHKEGIIHRDLKPGNVIIDGENEPIVMDFGLARRLDGSDSSRITQDGVILGTPAYMSPEQVSGELGGTGPRSDIYSVGVMLYELLTGDVPFGGPIAAVLGQIMMQEPQPPSKLRQGLDPRLESICLKMMAQKQDERYASMKDVSTALAGFLKGESPLARMADPIGASTSQAADAKRVTQPAISATMVGNEEMQALAKMFSAQTSDAHPIAEAVKHPRHASAISKKAWIVMAAAAAACVLVAGIVLSIGTDTGTIKINLPDSVAAADLRIVIDGNDFTLGNGGMITLETGQHKVEVFHKGRRLATDTLVVISGKINSITVPAPPVVSTKTRQKSVKPLPTDDRKVAQWLFDTGSFFTFRTVGGREETRWNVKKKKGTVYAKPLPEESFELTSIWFYSGTAPTDADMPKLRNLNSLETLIFRTSGVTSRGLDEIKHLPRLKRLDLVKARLAEDDYRVVAQMKQLKSLHVSGIDNDELAYLSSMTGLTSLTIHSKGISDAGLEHLANLNNLETLSITYGPITGAGLVHLKGMKNLRSLSLYSTEVGDSGLKHLEELTGLRILHINETGVSDAGMESVARLTGLTTLYLSNTNIGDTGLEHLSALRQMQRLILTDTNVTSVGLSYLKDLDKMEVLYLNGTNIDDDGLSHLRNMTALRLLYVANTNITITGSGLHHLTKHGSLSRLSAGGANFTERDAALDAIKQMSGLSKLFLYGVELTATEREDLQAAFKRTCKISAGDIKEEIDPDAELLPGEFGDDPDEEPSGRKRRGRRSTDQSRGEGSRGRRSNDESRGEGRGSSNIQPDTAE